MSLPLLFLSPVASINPSSKPSPTSSPSKPPKRRFRLPFLPSPKPNRPPPVPASEWRALIAEFESRAPPRVAPSRPSLPSDPSFRSTYSLVECAFMTALTTAMWYFGRVLKLDVFLMLLYPIPTMYISAKWGMWQATVTLGASVVFIFLTVGPLYAVLYMLNSGLLAWVYAKGVCDGWRFWKLLLGGGIAKGIGLTLMLKLTGSILKYDVWKAVTLQTKLMLEGMVRAIMWLLRRKGEFVVSLGMVHWGVGAVIVLHSVYHVFCTLVMATLFLRDQKMRGELEKTPPTIPGLEYLIERSSRRRWED